MDAVCKYGIGVDYGFFGFSTHECSECSKNLSPLDLLNVLKKVHEDMPGVRLSEDETCCDQDITTTTVYPAETVEGTFFEEWTDTTRKHPLSPEQIEVVTVVLLPEVNEWGDDVYVEVIYTKGTKWNYGASYGYSTETKEASCYAN